MTFLAALIFLAVAGVVLWVFLGKDREEAEESMWDEYP